ncbi:hypothetical protein OG909_24075 [Streptomyces sp. NBC_01754]|uniref:hypothetical protein n=1 Tax=Streptomyces sp. NBC_01754 TaxID=2975930 RepID=UPI002DDC46D7|nr:hypothetical protein [Streptomyces sp. NBC_01754]WSC95103.1 hypothetical protein OG909_24075 [Streptomyces sp. NBC_01754]
MTKSLDAEGMAAPPAPVRPVRFHDRGGELHASTFPFAVAAGAGKGVVAGPGRPWRRAAGPGGA